MGRRKQNIKSRRRIFFSVVCLVVMLSVAYALPASAQIEMVDLGTLAGFANWRFSAATDINDAG
ncbi:MAG TPA: hypothetical protein VN328_02790, partial [Thermodesulfovibrionales bacterium]|nr:hypothetical protein [Thermodesulfovibrionales bacterium]